VYQIVGISEFERTADVARMRDGVLREIKAAIQATTPPAGAPKPEGVVS
jgi:hypothetical protein